MINNENIFRQYDLIIKSAGQASRDISKILNIIDSSAFSVAMENMEKQTQWINNIKPILNIPEHLSDTEQLFRKQFEEIEYISKLSQEAYESLKIDKYIKTLEAALPDFSMLNKLLIQMSSSYSTLWKSLEEKPFSFIGKSPTVIQQPSMDFYHASRLSFLLSGQQYILENKEQAILKSKHQNINTFLYGILPQIDPTLLNTYEGAIIALKSKNPDKQRHLTTSLRHLFKTVLHTLSPKDEFIKWNKDPKNIKDGCPTRRGRLLYIYRDINCPPFHIFIEKEITAILKFIDLLHKGTHSNEAPFNTNQLWAILYWMENIIYHLVKNSRGQSKY